MITLRTIPEKGAPGWAREVELRREIVAAMRLRAAKSERRSPRADAPRMVRMADPTAETRDSWQRTGDAVAQPTGCRRTLKARILAISDYEGLRSSRELLLQQGGYRVISVSSRAFFGVAWVRTFDLAILCQSVDENDAARIADSLRRCHPEILVLRIYSPRSSTHSDFDMELEGLSGPEVLLDAVRELLEAPKLL